MKKFDKFFNMYLLSSIIVQIVVLMKILSIIRQKIVILDILVICLVVLYVINRMLFFLEFDIFYKVRDFRIGVYFYYWFFVFVEFFQFFEKKINKESILV